jgi:4'-phosphopantetheinyl transferase
LNLEIDTWKKPSDFPYLREGELHIWRCRIQDHNPSDFEKLLSPDERSRADRFYFTKDRSSYVICRGTLRILLGRYVSLPPSTLQFQYSGFGKPSLSENATSIGKRIKFNLSHSNEFSLFAFTPGKEVGVDVEFIRPNVIKEEIAERFFSPDETQTLRSLKTEQQAEAFFRCWTRKEAFIKARGDGLSLPLDQFDVSLRADEPAALLRTKFDAHEVSRWSIYHLDIADGYSGAVAAEGRDHQVNVFSLD